MLQSLRGFWLLHSLLLAPTDCQKPRLLGIRAEAYPVQPGPVKECELEREQKLADRTSVLTRAYVVFRCFSHARDAGAEKSATLPSRRELSANELSRIFKGSGVRKPTSGARQLNPVQSLNIFVCHLQLQTRSFEQCRSHSYEKPLRNCLMKNHEEPQAMGSAMPSSWKGVWPASSSLKESVFFIQQKRNSRWSRPIRASG